MTNNNNNRKYRPFSKRIKLYNEYYRRSGLYKFFLVNLLKLILILAAIIVIILVVNKILIASGVDFKTVIENVINSLATWAVFVVFFASETILGWIPPDFFIIWAKTEPFENSYLNVTVLATLSYMGGIAAYRIGEFIRRFPKVNKYIEKKYSKNFNLIRKWGGLVVVMAALFPLPFATISAIAGIVRYPFRSFLLFGLTRYLRFYLYAAWIFWGLNNLV